MSLAEFESLLLQTMGLDAASIGSLNLERAVRERQASCRLDDRQAYLERVRSCEVELQELVEAIVVPETWFFRDENAFAALGRIVQQEWSRLPAGSVLRLLSLPCASGEEPYSMAMALLDAGIPSDRFVIDAADISARILERGEAGIYGKNSFRGKELSFRERYFTPVAEGYRITDAVRRPVRFQQGNLLAPGFLPGAACYDIIFCRNLLIYLESTMRQRAIDVLKRLLADAGRLFVAAAETGLLLRSGFASAKVGESFTFRKAEAKVDAIEAPAEAAPARLAKAKPAPVVAPAARQPTARPVVRIPPPLVVSTVPPTVSPDPGLGEAGRLADQGRLAEAATLCERFLQTHEPNAEAFHLLGLVRDADGKQEQAAECYRKALYLDPSHHEALIHLACLLEKQGDGTAARRLRERAERSQGRRPEGR
jgi:chemotaxis protein methyltransferase WspC